MESSPLTLEFQRRESLTPGYGLAETTTICAPNVLGLSRAQSLPASSYALAESARSACSAVLAHARRPHLHLPQVQVSAVEYRPADVVSQPLIVQDKIANRIRQLVALPATLEPAGTLARAGDQYWNKLSRLTEILIKSTKRAMSSSLRTRIKRPSILRVGYVNLTNTGSRCCLRWVQSPLSERLGKTKRLRKNDFCHLKSQRIDSIMGLG
jgi:hypothetical protein